MSELVGQYGNGSLSLKEIAEGQQLSRNYLENLFNAMKVGGLVRSKRGPGGGWQLARPPQEITLTQVLESLEGELGVVDCVDHPDTCKRQAFCPTREIYVEISDAIRGVLDRYTIADLHARQIELEALAPDDLGLEDLCLSASRSNGSS